MPTEVAPSAGVAETTVSTPISAEVGNGAAMSDEQKLASVQPDVESYRAEPDEVTPEADTTAEGAQTDKQQVSEEITAGAPLPDWAKRVAKADVQAGAEIQRLWDQHQAMREAFPTLAEARAVRELFPGGAEEAKQVYQQASAMQESDRRFLSGDPAQQGELIREMYSMGPKQFEGILKVGLDSLKQSNPEGYRAFADELAMGRLQEQELPQAIDAMAEAYEKGDAATLNKLFTHFLGWAKGTFSAQKGKQATAAQPSSREQELQKQLDSLKEREAQAVVGGARGDVEKAINDKINPRIDEYVKGIPEHHKAKLRASLSSEIHEKLNQRLANDAVYKGEVAKVMASKQGQQLRTALAELITKRATLYLPSVCKEVMQMKTEQTIAQSKALNDKVAASASRVDISGGGITQGRPKPTLTKAEAREMSDEQIYDHAVSR